MASFILLDGGFTILEFKDLTASSPSMFPRPSAPREETVELVLRSSWGDTVFLLNGKEKFLNSWNAFASVSLQVYIHRERKLPPATAMPQELLDPSKRPGLFSKT